YSSEPFETGVDQDTLLDLARKLNTIPDDLTPHSKLKRLLAKRLEAVETGEGIDWANAEALAFASLVTQGEPIRLSGEDSGRGTFSQRHCVMFDRTTGQAHVPLNHLSPDQAEFKVYNSLLSEEGVLGFEYGYSLIQPQGLVIWEAQFGDFANTAQSIIDLYIVSGEAKWRRLSGLVMLLPHGLEGLGPEHSSARLERYLQLCAHENIQVCNLTTPAQYFHRLRRQALSKFRKPLIIMTPKSLLRHPRAVSSLAELSTGHFQDVLDDPLAPQSAKQIVFCNGKIFYDLLQRRETLGTKDVAIIRLEQFYPFPESLLTNILTAYPRAEKYSWVQEEPENMGGWQFVRPRLESIIGEPLHYIGREPAASPATGFANIYRQEQAAIVDAAIGPLPAKPGEGQTAS
ncbi:2-oxoglutarate dehydrogenase E1 component, partial [candidate division KSB3 bacterium]|nr:2-oxoglutarate dehydrogenase E1 component [candidate division KSB3 bacterium]MBD3326244.1 2-oxoglutarate dehydrogenase E1 component [candidate division KSB3 bacterium]